MRNLQRIRRARPKCRVDTERPLGHTVHVPVRDLKRLASAVKTAREQLGLSQEEFAKRGELALKTVQRLEWGSVVPRSKTLNGLDRAADWPPGAARGILDGVRPVPAAQPVAEAPLSAARRRIVEMSEEDMAVRIAEMLELRGAKAAGELLAGFLEIREEARQRT